MFNETAENQRQASACGKVDAYYVGVYSGNEYLQLYPVIKSNYMTIPDDYYVEWGIQRSSLKGWLLR